MFNAWEVGVVEWSMFGSIMEIYTVKTAVLNLTPMVLIEDYAIYM